MTDMNLYVANDENNMIYEVKLSHTVAKGKNSYSVYNLYLVAGFDYVDPDWSDKQGFVKNDRFIDDAQLETIVHYFVIESLEESLEESGYSIIDKLPKIW